VWPELNLLLFKEDEPAFLQRAQGLAREQQIYLLMGMATVQLGASRPLENKAVLVNPGGGIDLSYDKSRLTPGWEATLSRRPGDGHLPISNTPYGRLTAVICADGDYPGLMRQIGGNDADDLLLPTNDWVAIKSLHHTWRSSEPLKMGSRCSARRAPACRPPSISTGACWP
jgi:apolipoprotein N-acyltransferase